MSWKLERRVESFRRALWAEDSRLPLVLLGFALGVLVGFVGSLLLPRGTCETANYGSSSEDDFFKSLSCRNWVAPTKGKKDGWNSGLKHLSRAAACPVKGFSIEELDPEDNFRRGYTYSHVEDVEDRTYLLPYLLGARDPSLNKRGRKIYLDLGGKSFESSLLWFMRLYPLDFTEFHVFEINGHLYNIPPKHPFKDEELLNMTAGSKKRSAQKPVPVLNSLLDAITLYNVFVSDQDGTMTFNDAEREKIDITRFIKEELKAGKDDTLIVKMDIEGAEFSILNHWLTDKDMAEIVDELFVEVHYHHPSMQHFGWDIFSHTREETTALFQELRRHGFYVHAWP